MRIFRQQVHYDDDKRLARLLGLQRGEVENFDVFVTELWEGNLNKESMGFTREQSIDICKQLLQGLQQLETSDKCHNDLKPENILTRTTDEKYENGEKKVEIVIGDFGTADRSGGTPGWTWPRFLTEREPGRSDMHSCGLMILYVMCDRRELFYRLRDNYVKPEEDWLMKFRTEEPLIEFVSKMMKLEFSVREAIAKWDEISDYVYFLNSSSIQKEYQIPTWSSCLAVQDNMDQNTINMADATLLDK